MEKLYKYVLQQAKDAYAGTGVHQFDDVATLNIEVGKLIAYKDVLHKMKVLVLNLMLMFLRLNSKLCTLYSNRSRQSHCY